MRVGVDTGGTFTDFVVDEGGRLRVHKVLSTPGAPERAILQGLGELGLMDRPLTVVHGSTVATNAVLEGKGARTALVTNRGFGDLLTIGRQARAELYELTPGEVPPPVPRELCWETGGRIGADGTVLDPLTEGDLAALRARVAEQRPESVAICLLFAFADATFEQAIERALGDAVFVARSSEVLPEYREYERAVATWLNARVGPLMQGYLMRLARALPAGSRLAVMQSAGQTVDAEAAGRRAVHLLLSGPAGGLEGARFVAGESGVSRVLSFDMGGTSTDVALIDGAARLTSEGRIGPYPVGVPMVDMHTIGAGGGSIAYADAGGLLQVGPESAGADPGPACYGRGGQEATVTDAHVVLGRLPANVALAGRHAPDAGAARAAVGRLAANLGLDLEATAAGIIALADEHMARALRVISVQRGIDPRGYALLSFGGAGGLHVCALAEALGMRRALVPVHAGVLSALGMLAARPGRTLSQTRVGLLDHVPAAEIESGLEALARDGRAALADEGIAGADLAAAFALDLRYAGQSYTLTVPWAGGREAATAAFHGAHAARYGHRLDAPVELVNLRAEVSGSAPSLRLDSAPARGGAPAARVAVRGVGDGVPVWRREDLGAGAEIEGPAIVTDPVATAWIAPGWRARADVRGTLALERTVTS